MYQNHEKEFPLYDNGPDTIIVRPPLISLIVSTLQLDTIGDKNFKSVVVAFFDQLSIDPGFTEVITAMYNGDNPVDIYGEELEEMISNHKKTRHTGATDQLKKEAKK